MSTATEQTPAASETPVDEAPGFSMTQFFEEKQGGKKEDVKPVPPVEGAPDSQAKKPNEDQVSETPTGKPSEEPEKSETSEEKPMSKHEREKYKLREAKRRADEERTKVAKELAELKAKYGEEPETQTPQMDEATKIRLQERMTISKKRFLETHGQEKLDEKITGDEAPWKEIEERAQARDPEAVTLLNRAFSSEDPYREAMLILEEQEIYEQYGTRSISQIIAKALAEREDTITQQVMAKLTPTNRHETGKPPKTLGSVHGSSPAVGTPMPEDFSMSDYFGKRGT